MAVYAKVKGQEDKIATGLTKLNEEDCSFTFGNSGETKEMIISGVGDIHLDVLCAKLKSKYNVEAELRPAKIAYRETIKKKVEVHGRHKKQSGGHGQFGDVYIRFEPQQESEEMIFADETVGGCVPKNFIPSVEKGLRNCVGQGRPGRLPRGVPEGHAVFRLLSPGGLLRYGVPDGCRHRLQRRPAHMPAPTLLEPIGELKVYDPRCQYGRHHRRPEQAPRPYHGYESRPQAAVAGRLWRLRCLMG